jgi:hypothetical protein
MSRTIISTLSVAAVLMGVGCFRAPDAPNVDGRWTEPDYGYTESSLITVMNGEQNGDMGEIRGFSGAARDMSGYGNTYTSGYSNIRLDTVTDSYWVMSSLNISGDLAGPAFAPGSHRTFASGVYEEGAPTVSVTGCSGPEFGNYTFDSSGGDVEISVQSLPGGMRRMDFTVRFADGLETHGSFDYRIESEPAGTTRGGI